MEKVHEWYKKKSWNTLLEWQNIDACCSLVFLLCHFLVSCLIFHQSSLFLFLLLLLEYVLTRRCGAHVERGVGYRHGQAQAYAWRAWHRLCQGAAAYRLNVTLSCCVTMQIERESERERERERERREREREEREREERREKREEREQRERDAFCAPGVHRQFISKSKETRNTCT